MRTYLLVSKLFVPDGGVYRVGAMAENTDNARDLTVAYLRQRAIPNAQDFSTADVYEVTYAQPFVLDRSP